MDDSFAGKTGASQMIISGLVASYVVKKRQICSF
jgi:hypothetical protein